MNKKYIMHVMQNALMHTWTTTAFSSVHSAGATLPPQGSMNSQAASLEPKALQQNGAFAAEGKTAVPTCYLHWRLCTKCLNEKLTAEPCRKLEMCLKLPAVFCSECEEEEAGISGFCIG